jgi:hypothetical protein
MSRLPRNKLIMKSRFDCDDLGELTEYVGCKIETTESDVILLLFIPPALLQSYQDQFKIERERPMRTPTKMGKAIVKCAEGTELTGMEQTR